MNEGTKTVLAVMVTALVCVSGTYVLTEGPSEKGSISIEGSTSIQPLMDLFSEEFGKYSNTVLNIQGGGSGVGVSSAASGKCDIGMVSRDLKDTESSLGLHVTRIGLDAVVVIVHDDVAGILREDGLTIGELRGIFSGTVTNWNQLDGVSEDRRVNPVIRESSSGTRDCFESVTKASVPENAEWPTFNSTGAVIGQVRNTPGSIGYISLGSVTPELNVVDVGGVEAAPGTVHDGTYGLQRSLNLVTKGEPAGRTAFLLNWILSAQGQGILSKAGFVPLM